jgi:hypothetical protein
MTAVEIMSERKAEDIFAEFEARLQTLEDRLKDVPGLSVRKHFGTDVGKPFHHLRVAVDKEVAGLDEKGLFDALDEGDPRVTVGELATGELMFNAEMLNPGEEYIVAGRVADIVRQHR